MAKHPAAHNISKQQPSRDGTSGSRSTKRNHSTPALEEHPVLRRPRAAEHALPPISHRNVLSLQKRLGNRTVGRMLQRQEEKKDKKVYIGTFYFFDWRDKLFKKALAYKGENPPAVRPGYYQISLSGSGNTWRFTADGNDLTFTLSTHARSFRKAASVAKSVYFAIHTNVAGPAASTTRETGAYQPGGTPDGPEGDKGAQGGSRDGAGNKGGPEGGSGDGTKGGTGEKSHGGDKEKEGKRGPSGRVDGAGKGAEQGSKYGYLNLFNLPPEVISVLEETIEALGKSEELLAMRDTLQSLGDLAKHRAQLEEMFENPKALLEIILGLKENQAVDALAGWASQATRQPRPARRAGRAGIVRLAYTLVGLLHKVRLMLKPVFRVRGKFQALHAQVGSMMAMLPILEQLLAMVDNPKKAGNNMTLAAETAALEFGETVHAKMEPMKTALQSPGVFFSKNDFVSYEQVASAVVNAVVKAVPAAYKPFVYMSMELGLDQQIADNLVAPMIPKDALDAINGTIRSLGAKAAPTIKESTAGLSEIIDGIDETLAGDLPGLISGVLVLKSSKPSGRQGAPDKKTDSRSAAASSAETMPPELQDEMSDRLGFDVDDVFIHKDPPAQKMADELNAHAFAYGDHIYFGKGEYAPHTHSGKQLLAHELVHVDQMRRPGAPLQLLASYRDLLTRLSKKYSSSVINELKGSRITSKAKRDKATKIKDKVEKLIGRKVISKRNPRLPEGYSYVEKRGRIASIRRHFNWIRFIPALTIDKKTHRIKLRALLPKFDPKAAARKKLRRSLTSIRSSQEAHHVIPLELKNHPLMKLAEANGWDFNGRENGVGLSNTLVHKGSHPRYTQKMLIKLNALQKKYGTNNWSKIKGPLQRAIDKEKTELKRRRSKLR